MCWRILVFGKPKHVFADYLKDDYTKSPKSLLIPCFVGFLHVFLGEYSVPLSWPSWPTSFSNQSLKGWQTVLNTDKVTFKTAFGQFNEPSKIGKFQNWVPQTMNCIWILETREHHALCFLGVFNLDRNPYLHFLLYITVSKLATPKPQRLAYVLELSPQ